MKIEIEIPTEIVVWQSPDKLKDTPVWRLPLLFAVGHHVQSGAYVKGEGVIYYADERIPPEKIDWWANLPIPPGCTEAAP